MNINQHMNNDNLHNDASSLYAHYSMIDRYDVDAFPTLSRANPIRFQLESGQSLYIPKRWWHWVITTQKTFAVNYWFNNKKEQPPFVFDHSIDFDVTLLNDQSVFGWEHEHITNFKEFYNSGKDLLLFTLDQYSLGRAHEHIKNKLSDHILEFPIDERIICGHSYTYNLFVASNRFDTGLHYDDEDGILTVVEGKKDIILFPPSDTEHLYPYQVTYRWKETPALDSTYNSNVAVGKIDGVSSGELLYATCNQDQRVLRNISKLYEKYQDTHLIWGFKKIGNEYKWEIYNYTLENNIKITSWDIYKNEYDIPDVEHYYLKIKNTPSGFPFFGYGRYKKNNVIYDESKIFVIDDYYSFYENYDQYMDRLEYTSIKETFKDTILHKYKKCYEICIHNKTPNQIFVQYLGLTNDEFVEFLTTNDYPQHIIGFVTAEIELGRYNIKNEITIVYDTETQEIIRSGFYGMIYHPK